MSELVEVKTADLVGAALDWTVAKVDGSKRLQTTRRQFGLNVPVRVVPSYSTHWNHIGPLIEIYRISLEDIGVGWIARQRCITSEAGSMEPQDGETPLIAACRAIVASVLGETVSVPKELLS